MREIEKIRPIICDRAEMDSVRRALATQQRNGILPEKIDVMWQDLGTGPAGRHLVAAHVILPPKTAPRPKRRDSTFVDIGKALAFVSIIGATVLTFLVLAWLALTHSGINWPSVAGLIAVGLVVMLLIGNRSNHSGACPGLHCSGCKGH